MLSYTSLKALDTQAVTDSQSVSQSVSQSISQPVENNLKIIHSNLLNLKAYCHYEPHQQTSRCGQRNKIIQKPATIFLDDKTRV